MWIAVIAAFVLLFMLLPSAVIALLLFGRKRIADLDRAPEGYDWSTYAPYKEQILSAIAEMRSESREEAETVSNGDVMRAEWYWRGRDKTAIMLHGFCSTPLNNFAVIGREFLKRGYNLLLVCQRGHNESGGRFTLLGSAEQYDLLKWIEWTERRAPGSAIALYGVSMGGAAIGYASDKIDSKNVKAMVLDCCISSPIGQMTGNSKLRRALLAPITFLIGVFTKLFMGLDIRNDIREPLRNAKIPAFFIGGTADEKAPEKLLKACRDACGSESELMLVEGAPHALAFTAASEEERGRLFGFLEKHLINDQEE